MFIASILKNKLEKDLFIATILQNKLEKLNLLIATILKSP